MQGSVEYGAGNGFVVEEGLAFGVAAGGEIESAIQIAKEDVAALGFEVAGFGGDLDAGDLAEKFAGRVGGAVQRMED